MPKAAAKSFRATLERMDSPLKWVIVRIPFDIHKLWGKRGQIRVRGQINGFAFRTALFPEAGGKKHVLLVNKKMQSGARAKPGDTVQIRLEADLEEREAAMPDELAVALGREWLRISGWSQITKSA